jgi:hypothetical protein
VADYDYLPASNGSGDAPLMHVTGTRAIAATSIAVDSVTNVPTKFIATYGVLGSDGLITAASKRDFKGHVSGSTLVIDAFEPGSADNGNAIGDVVIIKPNSGWANRVAAFIKNAANFGTPEAVTFSAVQTDTVSELTASNGVTVAGLRIKSGALADSNGKTALVISAIASAVNYLKATNAATTGAPTLTADGSDTDVWWKAAGKGAGFFVPQLKVLSTALANTGTTEAVAGTLNIPSMPFATTIFLTGWAYADLGSGAPSQDWSQRIKRGSSTAGTQLAFGRETKSGATAVGEQRTMALHYVDSLAASTAQSYVWTAESTVSVTTSGRFSALVFAQ